MKKQKRATEVKATETPPQASFVWWPWAAVALALFVAFEAYGPALRGPFVLDDLYTRFANSDREPVAFRYWLRGNRPFLTLSFYLNFLWSGAETYSYHWVNVFLHVCGAVVLTLVVARLLDKAEVSRGRVALSVLAGGLFLLHPVQTESVAYISSRSEVLSVLLFLSAFGLFVSAPGEKIGLVRCLGILVLFGTAVTTKEHTVMLPLVLVLADVYWSLGGWRKNGLLYGMLAAAAVAGGLFVAQTLAQANTAGFNIAGLSPATYFLTEGRVIVRYLRLFAIPVGLNADPDVPLSLGPLEHGAIFAWLAIGGAAVLAWMYRRRFPLAGFGLLVFLLLLAPTSTIVPIRDVMAERRLYLPFLGLVLICVEFARRLAVPQIAALAAAVLAICTVLTYQRSAVWGDPMALWEDSAAKSPNKQRPRFQLARTQFGAGNCPEAVKSYDAASRLGPVDAPLLVDWGLALECAGQPDQGVAKLVDASKLERTAHVFSQIGMVYAKQRKFPEALAALQDAEKLDASFPFTYVYRGGVLELSGDAAGAKSAYERALALAPNNRQASEGLARVSR